MTSISCIPYIRYVAQAQVVNSCWGSEIQEILPRPNWKSFPRGTWTENTIETITFVSSCTNSVISGQLCYIRSKSKIQFCYKLGGYCAYFETNENLNALKSHSWSFKAIRGHLRSNNEIWKINLDIFFIPNLTLKPMNVVIDISETIVYSFVFILFVSQVHLLLEAAFSIWNYCREWQN